MHVLIVGLGGIGRVLATNLVAQGHAVTGMSRTPQTVLDRIVGVTHLAQSVHQANFEQLPPIDWVYVLLTPDDRSADSYRHIFIDSLMPLSTALQHHPVQRMVFISSTSVYGSGQPEWLNNQNSKNADTVDGDKNAKDLDDINWMDEATSPQPDTATGAILWQAEQQWQQVWAEKLVVVRPSGIYGPNRLRLITWVQQAKPVKYNQWTNRIHSADLAGFLAHLISLKTLVPLYIATDNQPSLQHEVLDYIAKQRGLARVAKIDAAPSGKKLCNLKLRQTGYVLQYPSYIEGYR